MKRIVNSVSIVPIVKLVIISFILLFPEWGKAQSPKELYSSISEEKWLLSNSVRVIFQDSKGFIWVGTNSGVFKYNLHSTLNYNLTQKSTGRLLNNTIHSIAEDIYGNILVGTESGLGVLDAVTGECQILSSIAETVTKIIVGKNNLIWIATSNGSIYRIVAQPFKNYKVGLKPFTVVSEGGNPINASTIFEMPDGTVLLGTSKGIYRLDISNQKAVPTHFKSAVSRIFSYDFLHLYVGTQKDGLFLLTFSDKGGNDFKVEKVPLDDTRVRDGYIVNVSGISKRYIVSATRGDVFIADRFKSLKFFQKISTNAVSKLGAITYLYVDRTANIWIGSTRGLFKMRRQSLQFTYFDTGINNANVVNSLLNDGRGNIWIATSANGLHRYDQRTKKVLKVSSPNNVRLAKKASNGSVMAFSGANLLQLSEDGPPRVVASSVSSVQDMLEVGPGEWWLASWKDGLIRYLENSKTDSIDLFQKIKNEIGNEVPVFCMIKDSRQRVWIGTRGKGIFRVDLGTGEISHFYKKGNQKDRSNRILCLYEDSKKRIWVGTRGDGLLVYYPESERFVGYGASDGLPSNSVCAVQENSYGAIWVSTLNGIARYKPGYQIEFQSYNVEDGIGSAEFNFNAAAPGDRGEVYFANGSGFYSFKKSSNPTNTVFPVVFTNFEIYSKDKSDKSQLYNNQLLQEIIGKRSIILDPEQNSFEISFAALDFTNPEKNRYLYRLMNLDSTWKFVQGAKATASFHSLPAGVYEFQVLSSNSQGEWNEKPVLVNIVVKPHFWLSTPAYILYGFLFLVIVLGGWLIWKNWFNLRKKFEQEREISQKQSQQMVLYTDLSHEIKNRLSLILGPLEIALSDKRVNRALLNNLYNQTQRLKRLTDQILSIRQTESGNFILNVAEENILKLIKRLYSESSPLATVKDLQFSYQPKKESIVGWCDEELLEIITMNLLGNAIKYVNVGGKVEMKADVEYLGGNDLRNKGSNEGNYLILTISNTGEGIPKEDIDRVTELFYRSAAAKSNAGGGAGVGLNLVARLVDLHHGFMEILSEVGELTTITIQLPIDKYQYSISELKPNMISSPIVLPLEETGTSSEQKTNKSRPEETEKRKVLVVDDQPELAALVKDCLKDDFEVHIATGGKEALERLKAGYIELIISDLVMPEMDGLTLCRAVRSINKYNHIPFIILTGRNSEEQKLICFQNGVDDFIEKPFSPELLKWKTKSILRQKRALREEKKNVIIVTPGAEISESPEEVFIQKIVNAIEEDIDKEFLDADFLAEKFFMSRATFYRKMESLAGESPSVFIRKYRMKKSAKLLKSGHYNVSTVAQKVGFKDPKYFSKCFQKEFGMSPSEYLEKGPLNSLPE